MTSPLEKHYDATPWLGMLRALELVKVNAVKQLLDRPILDLGCGDGFVAKAAFGIAKLDVAIDIDRKALGQALLSHAYQSVVHSDAKYLPLKDCSFHSVYSNGAMEHMEDLDSVLKEINRILIPGGRLVTFVPSDKFRRPVGRLSRKFGQRMWRKYNSLHNHVNLLSEAEWHDKLDVYGFFVEGIQPYGNEDFAGTISDQDLCSKLHLTSRKPFLQLRHCGNVGKYLLAFYRRLGSEVDGENSKKVKSGYWLMIHAIKRSLLA